MSEDLEGRARVLFSTEWLGEVELPGASAELASTISALDAAGLCPVLSDGLAGGNAAMLVDGRLFVTPSGRRPGPLDPGSLVEVVRFDPASWSARYRSARPALRPTSDTPLYDAILRGPASRAEAPPLVALHGHALASEADARRLSIPIGPEATDFSTPADRDALVALVERAPWPAHRAWIRRGHGFFVVGRELAETLGLALGLLR